MLTIEGHKWFQMASIDIEQIIKVCIPPYQSDFFNNFTFGFFIVSQRYYMMHIEKIIICNIITIIIVRALSIILCLYTFWKSICKPNHLPTTFYYKTTQKNPRPTLQRTLILTYQLSRPQPSNIAMIQHTWTSNYICLQSFNLNQKTCMNYML